MTELQALWLPILLSSVIVFIASSIVHMVLPWHHSDYPKLSKEDQVMDALRPLGIPPGDYFVPRPSGREDMQSEKFKEKLKAGPSMVFTILPSGGMAMGRNLSLWFVYLIVVGIFSGYVASAALPPGTSYLKVFPLAGTTAFVGYSLALWQMSIWYN